MVALVEELHLDIIRQRTTLSNAHVCTCDDGYYDNYWWSWRKVWGYSWSWKEVNGRQLPFVCSNSTLDEFWCNDDKLITCIKRWHHKKNKWWRRRTRRRTTSSFRRQPALRSLSTNSSSRTNKKVISNSDDDDDVYDNEDEEVMAMMLMLSKCAPRWVQTLLPEGDYVIDSLCFT